MIICPCGISFEIRPSSKKRYCTLECSFTYSTLRGRKPGCVPWNKGMKGVYETINKGISCSEETKEKLCELYDGRAITLYGRGGDPSPTMLQYAAFLCPLGYEMDTISIPIPTGSAYTLDFAHREAKIDIEIDGKTHIGREVQDARRDAYLKILGWKVIRVKSWT